MKRLKLTIICCLALLYLSQIALAETIHVPLDQPTIQAGIDAAQDGDTVLVASGTYIENINFNGKAIRLASASGAEATIIDGNQLGSVVTFDNYETADSVLDGFTIRNGSNQRGGGLNILNASPRIANSIIADNSSSTYGGGVSAIGSLSTFEGCTLRDNTSGWGGGLYALNAHLVITDCRFTGNTTSVSGGGMLAAYSIVEMTDCELSENSSSTGGGLRNIESSWKILRCTINRNNAVYGGGIFSLGVSGLMEIKNSTIAENVGTSGGGGISYETTTQSNITDCIINNNVTSGKGGGVFSFHSNPILINTTVSGNQAEDGGGVAGAQNSVVTLLNSLIVSNQATHRGGGAFFDNTGPAEIRNTVIDANNAAAGGGIWSYFSNQTITNTTIIANTAYAGEGGGIYLFNSDPLITNVTFAGNTTSSDGGGAIWGYQANLAVANSILWGDSLPEIRLFDSSGASVTYSDVQMEVPGELWPGTGNINIDPLFIGGGDYQLDAGSACIDVGDPSPTMNDLCLPPSLGSERNDAGAFGGPGACCWEPDDDSDTFNGEECGGDDCDDTNPDVNPDAPEVCDNGIDDNCDGTIDLDDPACCWDNDGDDYKDAVCGGDDCDDSNPDVNPGMAEICGNGIDDDCNGFTDHDDAACPILEMSVDYAEGTLSLNFTIGTLDSFVFSTALIVAFPEVQVFPLWSLTLPAINPPDDFPVAFDMPGIGWIGIYSGLYTLEGELVIDDLEWVDTGF